RATRDGGRVHSRSRRALPPLPSKRCADATRKAQRWTLRFITGASKRGEPLREGRLWRSRRSGRRGRVGGAGSTLAAAPGCPALTTWVRHAEALRAAAHPASRRTRQTKKSPPGGI